MDRIYLLAPAFALVATMVVAFIVYCGLYAAGRVRKIAGVKHNELFGPFMASYLVWLIGPAERLLLGRVSPNVITVLSVALCGVTGVAIALGHLSGAVWLYAVAGILDVLDGRLARLGGKQTAAGALLDSVCDRWGELFVFAGFAWFFIDSAWILAVMGAFGGSMMVSYTRARAESLGVDLASGMMQRAERIVLVVGGTLVAAWYGADPDPISGASAASTILGFTMVLTGVLSSATALSRWVAAYRSLTRPPVVAPEPTAVPAAPPSAKAPARAALLVQRP